MGKVATSPLPSRGSPPLQSGGQNQKWPTCRQSGYVTPAVSGIPNAAKWGGNQKWPTSGQSGYVTRAVSGIPTAAERGGGGIRNGPEAGKVATSPVPSRASPPLQSGEKNQKCPTYGLSGYVTPAVSGSPTAAERGEKTEVAHLWAKWLRHPCRLRDPHRFRAGGKIRNGPLVGKVATSPLPSRGSPPLQSGGKSRRGPQVGRVATSPLPSRGSPPLQSGGGGGGEIKSGPEAGKVATSPLPSRGSPPLQSGGGGGIKSGPEAGKVATSPLPARESPPLESGGQNQKWPTSGQSGYVIPAGSGIPTAAEQGGEGIRSGKVAMSPLPSRESLPLQSRGGESEVAHLWARWLRHPCRPGDPHRFRAGGEIKSGPLVG